MIRSSLRGAFRTLVQRLVLAEAGSAADARGDLDRLRQDCRTLAARVQRLEVDRRRPLVDGRLTVARAWRLHPGVPALFLRRHLPDCPSCPVGEDETLEEMARAHGFPLAEMIDDLERSLLRRPPTATSRMEDQ